VWCKYLNTNFATKQVLKKISNQSTQQNKTKKKKTNLHTRKPRKLFIKFAFQGEKQ
jgi:hypothetical protein